jgi:hypothetical protein
MSVLRSVLENAMTARSRPEALHASASALDDDRRQPWIRASGDRERDGCQ